MLGDSEDDSVATDMIQKLKRIIADKDQTIAHLAESLTQKEGQVREMDKSIAEKSTGMLALSREVAEKNGKIEEILAELSDLKEVLAKKDERCCAQIHEHILEYVRTAGEEDEQKICRTREDVVRKNGKLEELLKKFSSELHELSACIAKKNRQIEEMHQTIEELQIRLSHLETEYVAKRKLNNAKKLRELQNLSTVSVEIEESINKLRRETASIADCNKRDNCRTCETVNSITSATYRPPTSCASSTEISSLSKYSRRVHTAGIERKRASAHCMRS